MTEQTAAEAVKEVMTAFEEFKTTNDARLKEAIKSGQYVVIWKAKFTDMPNGTSNTILVYEGWEDTDGNRYVAMADTKVKKMTAKEFEAAPKAQGR